MSATDEIQAALDDDAGCSGEDVRDALTLAGYVILKAKSVDRVHERRRIAEVELEWAKRDMESSREWARNAFTEERRLRDRCTFLYGAAIRAGASEADLAGRPASPLSPVEGEPTDDSRAIQFAASDIGWLMRYEDVASARPLLVARTPEGDER